MIPVVEGHVPVMFSANSEKEIQAVIDFIQKEKIKVILYGAREAEKMVDKIKELEIPVILGSLLNMPSSWEDGYDAAFRTPAALQKAGVLFAFSSERYLPPLSVDLPYQASKAVAFGLDRKEALKAVTINPARIFGVDDRMGSIESGKVANIVLADGDILDRRTTICHVLIDGKSVDLSNEYTDLLRKFEERIKPKKIQ
jgi:imidazolonepropionase-like amidohydrolase